MLEDKLITVYIIYTYKTEQSPKMAGLSNNGGALFDKLKPENRRELTKKEGGRERWRNILPVFYHCKFKFKCLKNYLYDFVFTKLRVQKTTIHNK